jgi:hypothetical protein
MNEAEPLNKIAVCAAVFDGFDDLDLAGSPPRCKCSGRRATRARATFAAEMTQNRAPAARLPKRVGERCK